MRKLHVLAMLSLIPLTLAVEAVAKELLTAP
jgi:hypothetical protein